MWAGPLLMHNLAWLASQLEVLPMLLARADEVIE
jgi:hypothetical protein